MVAVAAAANSLPVGPLPAYAQAPLYPEAGSTAPASGWRGLELSALERGLPLLRAQWAVWGLGETLRCCLLSSLAWLERCCASAEREMELHHLTGHGALVWEVVGGSTHLLSHATVALGSDQVPVVWTSGFERDVMHSHIGPPPRGEGSHDRHACTTRPLSPSAVAVGDRRAATWGTRKVSHALGLCDSSTARHKPPKPTRGKQMPRRGPTASPRVASPPC